jgi:hypothetical protein
VVWHAAAISFLKFLLGTGEVLAGINTCYITLSSYLL